jgi:predicted TIM-barrel fold metal-dependent hydrolase
VARYNGQIIDSDVHNSWTSESELIPYLAPEWREFIKRDEYPRPMPMSGPRLSFSHPRGGVNCRLETFPADGGAPGSDYTMLKEQLLDKDGITCAVLATATAASNAALPNPAFSAAVIKAVNDWSIDRWLSLGDDRLYGVAFVPTQDPEAGAAEIARVAKNQRVVEARLVANGLAKPLGHRGYDPVYRAAADAGLPVSIHIHAGESQAGLTPLNAGGVPNSFLEFHTLFMQPAIHHVTSMIVNGTFERFPSLHFIMVETGSHWIPWLLWQLDGRYADLRRESTWLKRRPSEYFHDHVRVTTQPLEIGHSPRETLEYLKVVDGIEDVLCYSSDYPHWDADTVNLVERVFPRSWLEKLFYRNALSAYERLS